MIRSSRFYACNRNRFDSLSVRCTQYDRLSQQQLSFLLLVGAVSVVADITESLSCGCLLQSLGFQSGSRVHDLSLPVKGKIIHTLYLIPVVPTYLAAGCSQ